MKVVNIAMLAVTSYYYIVACVGGMIFLVTCFVLETGKFAKVSGEAVR